LAGGAPGRATHNSLVDGDDATELASKVTLRLRQGQLIRHEQAGGGGFGDPLEREAILVAADAWNEKISAEYARQHHGVLLDALTGRLDVEATLRLRAQRRPE
jgi:N-methylhydantoinase B